MNNYKLVPKQKHFQKTRKVLKNLALKAKKPLVSIAYALASPKPLCTVLALAITSTSLFGQEASSSSGTSKNDSDSATFKFVNSPVVKNYLLDDLSFGKTIKIAEPSFALAKLFDTQGIFKDVDAAKSAYANGNGPKFIDQINPKMFRDSSMAQLLKNGIKNYKIIAFPPLSYATLCVGNNKIFREDATWGAKINYIGLMAATGIVEYHSLFATYNDTLVTACEKTKTATLSLLGLDMNFNLKTPAGLFYLGAIGTFANRSSGGLIVPSKYSLYAYQADGSLFRLESIKAVFDNYGTLQDGSALVSLGGRYLRAITGLRYQNYNASPSYIFGLSTNFGYLSGTGENEINLLGNWLNSHINPYLAIVYQTPADYMNMQLNDGMLNIVAGMTMLFSENYGVSLHFSSNQLVRINDMPSLEAYLKVYALY